MPLFEFRTHESIRSVGEAEYRRLVGPAAPAFLRFEWLDALERTGCVAPERGWIPTHLTLHRKGSLVLCAPAYLKLNSEGEFVFDHSWARFSEGSLGRPYYPKLIVAVPFTPATGPRLVIAEGCERSELIALFSEQLVRWCERHSISGAHVLFPPAEEARELEAAGFRLRLGLQYHWQNQAYETFDEFLSRFSSKRRNQIRRERRALSEQGSTLEWLSGKAITPSVVDHAFSFYASTVDKYFWGRRYLNRDFFEEVCGSLSDAILIVFARDRATREPVGGTFNLLGPGTLYGRYWGAREERPFLHFNVAFYAGIEECIRRGLGRFEPGAGGEHKLSRGFEPARTHSAHFLRDEDLSRAVQRFLEGERAALESYLLESRQNPVLRRS